MYTRVLQTKHKLKAYFNFGLCWVFIAAHGLSLVVSGGYASCGAQVFHCSGFSLQSMGSWHLGSVVAVHSLSCPLACGILVPAPGIKPVYLGLGGGFLTTGPSGSPHKFFF